MFYISVLENPSGWQDLLAVPLFSDFIAFSQYCCKKVGTQLNAHLIESAGSGLRTTMGSEVGAVPIPAFAFPRGMLCSVECA